MQQLPISQKLAGIAVINKVVRTATKAVTIKAALSSSGVHQNIKSKSVESQYPKEGSQDASTVEQPMMQGNRKRSAEQSMQSSTPVTDSMTSELASMQPLSTAETYDKIFTVLMTQMEQLRPLFAIQDLSAKNIVRKMIASIRDLLADLMDVQTNQNSS